MEEPSSPGHSRMGITSGFLFGTSKAYATPENVVPKSRAMTRRSAAESVTGSDISNVFSAVVDVVNQLHGRLQCALSM